MNLIPSPLRRKELSLSLKIRRQLSLPRTSMSLGYLHQDPRRDRHSLRTGVEIEPEQQKPSPYYEIRNLPKVRQQGTANYPFAQGNKRMPTSPLRWALSTKSCGKDRLSRYWPQRYRPTSFTSCGGVGDAGVAASSHEPPRSTTVVFTGDIRQVSSRLVWRVVVHCN
ncbi:hypothetical protein CI102_3983 [Trichoderma harzianum]|nr:hypothetical protein CI102_3983 [Trichoderma harzianum]